jgi:two-component system NtrC family response regulator
VDRVAPTDSSVLVLGESGTGKELIARAIHERSPRATQAFVPIHCGALPREVLESELFGHEKGAFTGAVSFKPGLIELADGGTLFLDEIGEMEPDSQVKLLRVLESHAFFRVGGTRRRSVDMRLVVATNRDLAEAIRANEFRQDLYYRINTIALTLPPLRERPEDVGLLAAHFLEQNAAYGRKRISPAALRCMQAYGWPGNVRELENCIRRAVIMADGNQITAVDVGFADGASDDLAALNLRRVREDAEKRAVITVLSRMNGNIVKAAEVLGVSRPTLYDIMHKFGLK